MLEIYISLMPVARVESELKALLVVQDNDQL